MSVTKAFLDFLDVRTGRAIGSLDSVRTAAGRAVFAQELPDDGCLPGFFQQEAVVPIRRLDDVALDRLAESAKRLLDLSGRRRRVQPVRTERYQERPGQHSCERVTE